MEGKMKAKEERMSEKIFTFTEMFRWNGDNVRMTGNHPNTVVVDGQHIFLDERIVENYRRDQLAAPTDWVTLTDSVSVRETETGDHIDLVAAGEREYVLEVRAPGSAQFVFPEIE